MKAIGSVYALFSALCFVGVVGCSASSNTGGPTDAGAQDTGPDAGDVPVFIGPGNLRVTWTINGMDPAVGCATLGATTVNVQDSFGSPTPVPCETGTFSKDAIMAGQLSVGTTLLTADGTAIYCYAIPTTVVSDQTTTATVDFVPPGSARVRWTIGGMAPSAACAGTTATRMVVRVGNQPAFQASCATGTINFTGATAADAVCRPTMPGIQPGTYDVTVDAINAMGDRLQTQMAQVTVPTGGAGTVTVDFTGLPAPH